jgi:uncharacterized protein (DUF2236 family)
MEEAPDPGLFGPSSAVWRVNRELVVWLAGGGRALLLQIAHPLVAAAVAEHSHFQTDPLGRLRDTLSVSFTYLFGPSARARAAVAAVNRLHAGVVGALPEAAGRHPAGTRYRALDPALLLWVNLTSVDSWLLAYDRFVAPLSERQAATYYTESIQPGPLWGIPSHLFPPSLAAMRDYLDERVALGEVAVSGQARALAGSILRPPIWWVPGLLSGPTALVTVWLLPPAIRAGFGLALTPRQERAARRLAAASRWLVPRLPSALRAVPAARAAERRLAAAR